MKIYQCFRTGARQSIRNMCGSRNFYRGGGGGVQARWQENSLGSVFFCLFCLVLNLFTEGFQWFYFRGGPSFSRVVQMLISIETHITCDFLSPLWVRACIILVKNATKICTRQHMFVLLARKSQYYVNCPLAYDTHLKMPRLNLSEI